MLSDTLFSICYMYFGTIYCHWLQCGRKTTRENELDLNIAKPSFCIKDNEAFTLVVDEKNNPIFYWMHFNLSICLMDNPRKPKVGKLFKQRETISYTYWSDTESCLLHTFSGTKRLLIDEDRCCLGNLIWKPPYKIDPFQKVSYLLSQYHSFDKCILAVDK